MNTANATISYDNNNNDNISLRRVKLRELFPDIDGILVIGIIIGKQRPRKFLDRKSPVDSYIAVWNFTLRDSPCEYINVSFWGSTEVVFQANDRFHTGDVVEIVNPKIRLRSLNDQGEQYRPMVTSPYNLQLNERSNIVLHEGPVISAYRKLLQLPTKPLAGYVTIKDVHSRGASIKDLKVDILAVVKSLGNIRTVKARSSETLQVRTIEVFDHTSPKKWKPRSTVLFLTDLHVQWSVYQREFVVKVTSCTIVTENPVGREAQILLEYAKDAPVETTEIVDHLLVGPGSSKRVKYGDPDYEEVLLKWFDEVGSDSSDVEAECDKNFAINSDHYMDSQRTLVSYTTNINKAVILLSSSHHHASTDPEANKPDIIADYNCTKGGVDTLDEKYSKFSSSRRTQRWPMAEFFRLFDISMANAHILYESYRISSIQDVASVRQVHDRINNLTENNTIGSKQFTVLMYAHVTSLDLDGFSRLLHNFIRFSARCKIQLKGSTCDNQECPTNFENEPPKVEIVFDIKVDLMDHTGTLVDCKLGNQIAERMLGCTAKEFANLSDDQKCILKWKFLTRRCKVYLAVSYVGGRNPVVITVLDLSVANPLEVAQRLTVY
nr:unnamed protein product [Callosobruchus chinensis]